MSLRPSAQDQKEQKDKKKQRRNQEIEVLEAILAVFLENGCLGTGDALKSDPACFKKHVQALDLMLRAARNLNLPLKFSKCYFAPLEVDLLGQKVGLGMVVSDPKKTAAVRN